MREGFSVAITFVPVPSALTWEYTTFTVVITTVGLSDVGDHENVSKILLKEYDAPAILCWKIDELTASETAFPESTEEASLSSWHTIDETSPLQVMPDA